MASVLNLVSWNIDLREAKVADFLEGEGSAYDVALLQEAPIPQDSWEGNHYNRRAKVVGLSNRTKVIHFRSIPLGRKPKVDEFSVSAAGTIAAARIYPERGAPFLAVSLYARWEKPHAAYPAGFSDFSDAMAHRAISDLSAFIGHKDPARHRILIAGDFNLIYGATESNRLALPARERSVFARLEALGFEFLGPRYPAGGRADPVPEGLPVDTRNVPTLRTKRGRPETAINQLDYVFASRGFHEQITTRALNAPEEWGPSDHCRIEIDVDLDLG